MPTIKQQTLSGAKWLLGANLLQKAIQLCATIILARILGPADFGLVALAFVTIDALGLFKSMGFDSALIQRNTDVARAANTAFLIVPSSSVLLYVLLFFLSPSIAGFLNNQALVPVIRALGLTFVMSGFVKVPSALLDKSMQFRKVAVAETIATVVFSISAITMASLRWGIWSLIIAFILKTLVQSILIFIFAKWRPILEYDKTIALEMFHFGKFLFLGSLFWFIRSNLDNILAGKLLGVTALGLYAIAFNISNFGADFLSNRLNRVIFPAFSKLNADLDALRAAFLKTTRMICMVAFPFSAILAILSHELLLIVYGTKWLAAAPVLIILAFAGLINSIFLPVGPALSAIGRSKPVFWTQFLQTATFVILVIPAAHFFGLLGVAAAVLASLPLPNIYCLLITMKLLGMRWGELFNSILPTLTGTVAFAAVLIAGKCLIFGITGGAAFHASIFTCIAAACAAYITAIICTDRHIITEIRSMLCWSSRS
jgi:O-antigen/teichoic acid export membrane protein